MSVSSVQSNQLYSVKSDVSINQRDTVFPTKSTMSRYDRSRPCDPRWPHTWNRMLNHSPDRRGFSRQPPALFRPAPSESGDWIGLDLDPLPESRLRPCQAGCCGTAAGSPRGGRVYPVCSVPVGWLHQRSALGADQIGGAQPQVGFEKNMCSSPRYYGAVNQRRIRSTWKRYPPFTASMTSRCMTCCRA